MKRGHKNPSTIPVRSPGQETQETIIALQWQVYPAADP